MAAMEAREGKRLLIRARGGVILSAGGYAYDPETGRPNGAFARAIL